MEEHHKRREFFDYVEKPWHHQPTFSLSCARLVEFRCRWYYLKGTVSMNRLTNLSTLICSFPLIRAAREQSSWPTERLFLWGGDFSVG